MSTVSRFRRKLPAGVGAALLGAAATIAAAAPAHAATYVGGANLNNYCQTLYGVNATLVAPYDAWSWRCVIPGNPTVWIAVDMNGACQMQYGSAAFALLGSSNPYSWRCYV